MKNLYSSPFILAISVSIYLSISAFSNVVAKDKIPSSTLTIPKTKTSNSVQHKVKASSPTVSVPQKTSPPPTISIPQKKTSPTPSTPSQKPPRNKPNQPVPQASTPGKIQTPKPSHQPSLTGPRAPGNSSASQLGDKSISGKSSQGASVPSNKAQPSTKNDEATQHRIKRKFGSPALMLDLEPQGNISKTNSENEKRLHEDEPISLQDQLDQQLQNQIRKNYDLPPDTPMVSAEEALGFADEVELLGGEVTAESMRILKQEGKEEALTHIVKKVYEIDKDLGVGNSKEILDFMAKHGMISGKEIDDQTWREVAEYGPDEVLGKLLEGSFGLSDTGLAPEDLLEGLSDGMQMGVEPEKLPEFLKDWEGVQNGDMSPEDLFGEWGGYEDETSTLVDDTVQEIDQSERGSGAESSSTPGFPDGRSDEPAEEGIPEGESSDGLDDVEPGTGNLQGSEHDPSEEITETSESVFVTHNDDGGYTVTVIETDESGASATTERTFTPDGEGGYSSTDSDGTTTSMEGKPEEGWQDHSADTQTGEFSVGEVGGQAAPASADPEPKEEAKTPDGDSSDSDQSSTTPTSDEDNGDDGDDDNETDSTDSSSDSSSESSENTSTDDEQSSIPNPNNDTHKPSDAEITEKLEEMRQSGGGRSSLERPAEDGSAGSLQGGVIPSSGEMKQSLIKGTEEEVLRTGDETPQDNNDSTGVEGNRGTVERPVDDNTTNRPIPSAWRLDKENKEDPHSGGDTHAPGDVTQ